MYKLLSCFFALVLSHCRWAVPLVAEHGLATSIEIPPSALSAWETRAELSMRVLVVEDELKIRKYLEQALGEAGYRVDGAADARSAMSLAAQCQHDAMIVDLGLPDKDGLELITSLRQIGVSAPAMILSARATLEDRVKGLEQGGDDYMTKPFALTELFARLRNLIKRSSQPEQSTSTLRILDLEMDTIKRRVARAGESLFLTPQEFSLLEYLMRNAGRLVTRSMILENVWGMSTDCQSKVVETMICRLRSKVDVQGLKPLIGTTYGMGYFLRDS
jgi:two-component system copper resistance phosphate regulon response regulator CusR